VVEPIDRQIVMTGFKTLDEAKALAIQLAGGNVAQIAPAGQEIKSTFTYRSMMQRNIDLACRSMSHQN